MLLVVLLIIATFVAFGNNQNVEQKNQETASQNTEEQENPK